MIDRGATERSEHTEGDPEMKTTPGGEGRMLTEAARRALQEAEARRLIHYNLNKSEDEVDGRGGLDPVRYGDWEIKGLTSDF